MSFLKISNGPISQAPIPGIDQPSTCSILYISIPFNCIQNAVIFVDLHAMSSRKLITPKKKPYLGHLPQVKHL